MDPGAQADLVLIDPKALLRYDTDASRRMVYREIFEHDQLVNRSDGVVTSVFIAGEQVWDGRASRLRSGRASSAARCAPRPESAPRPRARAQVLPSNSPSRRSSSASFSRVRRSTAVCTSNSSRVTRSNFARPACSTPLKFCSRSRRSDRHPFGDGTRQAARKLVDETWVECHGRQA